MTHSAPTAKPTLTCKQNISTRIQHCVAGIVKNWRYTYTNTPFTHMKYKSTNTDPLVIWDPTDVMKLTSGLHKVTYNPYQQIFLGTNNANSIRPLNNKLPTLRNQNRQLYWKISHKLSVMKSA